jgi:hypothetical protein
MRRVRERGEMTQIPPSSLVNARVVYCEDDVEVELDGSYCSMAYSA